jgi:uncharacterized protein YcgL (UPF0745 family)
MLAGDLVYLDVATLTALQTSYVACLTAIGQAHQSYSISGRQFTRANLSEVRQTLAEIGYALQLKQGNIQRVVYSDFSNR